MSPDVRRAYDEATVILLRATSTPDALGRIADEERVGTPAYDRPGRLIWGDRVCGAVGCAVVFVAPLEAPRQRFCSLSCQGRDYYHRHAERWCGPSGGHQQHRRAAIAVVVAARAEVGRLTAERDEWRATAEAARTRVATEEN